MRIDMQNFWVEAWALECLPHLQEAISGGFRIMDARQHPTLINVAQLLVVCLNTGQLAIVDVATDVITDKIQRILKDTMTRKELFNNV